MITNFLQYNPFSELAIKERTPYVRGLEINAETCKHKFGGDPMAEYLYLLNMEGGGDDSCGESDFGLWVTKFGRRLLCSNDQGFVWVETHDDEESAAESFDEYSTAYGQWLDQDDEDEDDEDEGPWCETHDRPHVPGDLACELTMAENVLGTDD